MLFNFIKNIYMKNILVLFLLFFTLAPVFSQETTKLLTAEISMVPKSFYGTWRVVSKRTETDSPAIFKDSGIDLWNLSRTYDVISLCNMFNGAKADITVSKADSNHVVFTKSGKYDKKILSDKVELYLDGDSFTGTDTLQLDTLVNGKIVKTERAKYSLKGEKIGGQVITE